MRIIWILRWMLWLPYLALMKENSVPGLLLIRPGRVSIRSWKSRSPWMIRKHSRITAAYQMIRKWPGKKFRRKTISRVYGLKKITWESIHIMSWPVIRWDLLFPEILRTMELRATTIAAWQELMAASTDISVMILMWSKPLSKLLTETVWSLASILEHSRLWKNG